MDKQHIVDRIQMSLEQMDGWMAPLSQEQYDRLMEAADRLYSLVGDVDGDNWLQNGHT